MRLPTRSLAIGSGAIALTISMATAAVAGPPFTITVGSSTSGSYPVAGDSTGPVAITSGVTYSCSSVSIDGTIDAGTTSGKIADLTSSTWIGCSMPLGMAMSVQHNGIWEINALSGPDTNGTVQVRITNVSAHMEDTSSAGVTCSYDISGSVPATFDNATQVLAVNGSGLVVSNIHGCFGLITSTMNLSVSFQITDPTTYGAYPITIS